jgi:hypothetical protein
MTTQAEAVSKFLSELSIHFLKKFDSEEAEDLWLDSMERNLKVYSPSVLQRACQRIIDTRKDKYFPLPSECKARCDEIEKIDKASAPPTIEDKAKQLGDHADHRYRLADELIVSGVPVCRRAAQEGWTLSLHDFIRENMRLPTQDWEIRKCIDGAKGFDEAYEAVLNGKGGVCAKALEGLGDTMLKRREALRARVMGETA